MGTAVSVVALLLVASACGSDSDATRRPSPVDTAGLEAAKATVAKAAVRPTTITVTDADRQADPHGQEDHLRQLRRRGLRHPGTDPGRSRRAILGWTVDQVATDGSPEKVQGAIDAAIRNGSDAVILNAADQDAYAKQIADAKKAGVQFVTCCSLATAGDGILYNTATDKQNGPDR